MTDDEAVRETKNFIKSQAKVHGVDTKELMKMVKKDMEEGDENGG